MHCGVMWTSSGALVDKGQRLFPPNTLRILNHFKQNRFLKIYRCNQFIFKGP